MSNVLVTSSVNPSPLLTTFNVNTSHKRNETSAQAINIGNLTEESTIVKVSDQGATAGSAVSTSFTAQAGDVTSLAESFGNIVNEASTHFQLYDSSNNLIADNQGTTAQQQAYTQWVQGSLTLNAGTYTATATPGIGTVALNISTLQQQGTSLEVNSQLTGGDTSEYYNFALTAGNNIKLSFDAGSGTPSTRVQLYSSSGRLVADNEGNAYEKANFQALTSGTGLTSSQGNYSIKVSYANGADTTKNIKYNMQLYSGSNYAVVYNNNVTAQPADYSASGSVTATRKALAYSRQAFHTIDETAATAINIGWLAQNKSSLNVYSQLTSADSTDYYSFTLQSGDNLKFGFDTKQTKTPSAFHVQILDGSGMHVIADNQGTPTQQAAYKSLTTTNGLKASPGNYIVKIGYAANVKKTAQTYDFNLYSGTSYSAQYKTIASPQTYGNALLAGTVAGSTNSATAMAAYLTAVSNGGSPDIMTTLQSLV